MADASEALGSGTDESHTVFVPADGPAVVSAKIIYGAMRGLETLTQLVDVRVGKEGGASIPSCPVEISDAPR